jgi:hypothetical protein
VWEDGKERGYLWMDWKKSGTFEAIDGLVFESWIVNSFYTWDIGRELGKEDGESFDW